MKHIAAAIARALPARRPIGLHEPSINGAEAAAVAACLGRDALGYGCISALEGCLRHITGAPMTIATSSGTAALHLALLAAGVEPGDEVLVPALTFVATANAVAHCGAVPHFIDGPLCVNAHKLRVHLERATRPVLGRRARVNIETGRPVTALVPVHLLGQPANGPRLADVARQFGLAMVEDAAAALGTFQGNRHVGLDGRAAIISFNNNKICTTNGGGAIITGDEWIAARALQLATTARRPHPYLVEHDAVAWNYRMGNINAALGLAQLGRLDEFKRKKAILRDRYAKALADHPELKLMPQAPGANGWMTAAQLAPPAGEQQRNELLDLLNDDGINARALSTPLHRLAMYHDNPRDNLLAAEDAWARTICLPSGVELVQ